jgi:hypothetical protein
MRSRILIALAVLVAGFLVATNPVVADAARTITGKDIKDGSVTGKDIKDHSLTAKDLKKGLLASGPTGPAGPAGPRGPAGAAGAAGGDGVLTNSWIDYSYTRDSGSAPIHLRTDAFYGDVFSLSVGPGQRAGKITVTQAVRLFVTASVYVNNADNATRSVRCYLELRPDGGAAKRIGFITNDDVGAFLSRTVAVSGSEAVPAGTYDVALLCATQPANLGGGVFSATMSVLALR